MATYAVSDIHGCFSELMAALDQVAFGSGDELYVLGDIIDRGPQVGECVSWLVEQRANAEGSPVHFLLGNHEDMADRAFVGDWRDFAFADDGLGRWTRNGGEETLGQLRTLSPGLVDAFQQMVQGAPKAVNLQFGESSVLLSHAGIRPPEPHAEPAEWLAQAEADLLWIGTAWYATEDEPPFHVVSGHVPTMALWRYLTPPGCPMDVLKAGRGGHMMHWRNKHDIDCGCVFGGNLGILRLEDGEEAYVPSNREPVFRC